MSRLGTSPSEEGERLFVSHLRDIDRVIAWICTRHHLNRTDADDFSAEVKLKLIEDDYAVLRKFEGRSSMRTYLSVVIERVYFDFRVRAWGKWRPSAEAKKCGPTGILLERLTARDGHTLEEAYEILTTNHRIPLTRAAFESLAARLPRRALRRIAPESALANQPGTLPMPDAGADVRDAQEQAGRVLAALQTAVCGFEPTDRLILRMRFEDGCPVPRIASALRIDDKVLYRRLDSLIRDLRARLETAGIDAAAVRALLNDEQIVPDWSGEAVRVSVHDR